ncbi:MAG: hypothetical protein KBC15_02525 [Candidatus Levybacteria bacterium]|nr:hypothetical protein [Candidatus Levybacteria bacterium]
MQRAAILLVIIVGAILIAAALQDRGAEINDRKAQAGAAITATEIIDPAQATIEALQTQIAVLMGTVEPTINPTDATIEALQTQAAGLAGGEADPISTPEPTAAAAEEDPNENSRSSSTQTADVPTSQAEWVALVKKTVMENGGSLQSATVQDKFGAVKVYLPNGMKLPAGWEAQGGPNGIQVADGVDLAPGDWRMFPPRPWRDALGFSQ